MKHAAALMAGVGTQMSCAKGPKSAGIILVQVRPKYASLPGVPAGRGARDGLGMAGSGAGHALSAHAAGDLLP